MVAVFPPQTIDLRVSDIVFEINVRSLNIQDPVNEEML